MTWVILVWNALMVVWLVSGVASVSSSGKDCEAQYPLVTVAPNASAAARILALDENANRQDQIDACKAGSNVGAGLGAALIIFVWVAGDVVLGVIWLVTRPRDRRLCPVCGTEVKAGLLVCPSCGYDYRAALRAPS